MAIIDCFILGIYLLGLFVLGIFFARRAGQSSEHYFLGGRDIPWWALGASGMSSNLDVAGTMAIITMLYLFGLQGFFVEFRGGVVLPIAVFLAFMGKWHQRSRVMTTAEWMGLRFGNGWQGKAARMTAAVTYLIITIGMVVFFLEGAGKFLSVILPYSKEQCQIGLLLVALFYTMLSGLYGVVWTDVIQAFFIGGAAIYVAVVAAMKVTPELLDLWPGSSFNQPWPLWHDERMQIAGNDYRWFGILVFAWMAKGVLEGLGGSGGSAYMAQRFYAAKYEKDGLKIGMLWTLLFAFRWPMVLGFAILAISLGLGQDDPETILPHVINSPYFPPGIRGLVIAAMMAAAMSTFDSTINAGASYIVKDLYEPFRKGASSKELVWIGYLSSLFIVSVGLIIAFQVDKVVAVWKGIVIQLFPAFLVPFALRWYWERFNGAGFTIGVLFGFAAAYATYLFGEQLSFNEFETLFAIGACSLAGSVLGTYITPQVDRETRKHFYETVRPFGLWNRDWRATYKNEHRADFLRLPIALLWQISTFLIPMILILHMWSALPGLILIWIMTGGILLRDWKR